MKVLQNKDNPKITINLQGKILSLENILSLELQEMEIGKDVCEFVDMDAFRKLSMYVRRIEMIKMNLEKYPYAIARIKGEGIAKQIELYLIEDKYIAEDKVEKSRKMFELLNNNYVSNIKCIDIVEKLNEIAGLIKETKELSGKRLIISNENNFFARLEESQAELLIITTLFMLNEISFKNNIEIQIKSGNILELSVDTNNLESLNDISQLLDIYPEIASKMMIIESICEEEFIKIKVLKLLGRLSISYEIPSGKSGESIVKGESVDSSLRISTFINIFLNAQK